MGGDHVDCGQDWVFDGDVAELRREVAELRRANEILKKASAYFAQAELDRRPKR